MTYRNDVEALAARHDALAADVATKIRELDAARQLLDDAQHRARLPVLPNIRVASPCSADWNQMTGDERVRACASCNKNVYNLSDMTRDEAEALIVEKEGRLCVRYFQRKDGTILLKDCTIGVAQKRKRRLFAAGAAAVLAAGAFAALRSRDGGAEAPSVSVPSEPEEELMGVMAVMPEPEPPLEEELIEMKGDYAGDVVLGEMR